VDLEERVAMAPTKDAQKLRRAAERKGKAEDQFQLGLLLCRGDEGMRQDLMAAAKWWSKAVAQGHADAQVHLEMMGRSDVTMPIATELPGAEKRDVQAGLFLRTSTRSTLSLRTKSARVREIPRVQVRRHKAFAPASVTCVSVYVCAFTLTLTVG